MKKWIMGFGAGYAAVATISAAAGCGGSSTPSGSGGHGTTSSTTSGSTSTSTSSATTTSTSSTTGDAGTGGSSTACLDPSTFSAQFTIADSEFCAVAIYTAPESIGSSAPSWGSHHGPLTLVADASGGGVTLERWTPPASGTMGALTKQSTDVAVGVPTGAYLNAQANDLPFFGWTTVSWTGPTPATTGSVVAIANGSVAATYMANGPYAFAGVSDGSGQGRLLYTGLSALGSPSGNTNGLYAADACSSPSPGLGTGTGCSASALVSGWDEYSGPVVVDKNGDAFAVLTSASAGNQEARGFLAANVARGKGATPGVTLFTLSGFSGSMAAITPSASAPGVLVFQPFDSTSYDAQSVVAQRFTAGSDIAATGTTTPFLSVPSGTMAGLSFMTDDTDRLWVAYSDTSSTTYVVLARK